MKKIIFKSLLVFIICLSLFGCKKDEEVNTDITIDKPISNVNSELKKKIVVQDLGYIPGEYNSGLILFKVSNGNDEAVLATVNVEYYDNSGLKVDSGEVYVKVGSKKAAYALVRMFPEKVAFSTYKYTYSAKSEKNYDNIYSNVKVYYGNNNKVISVKTTNESPRVTTATIFAIFYNSNKIVDVKDYYEYNVKSNTSKIGVINYPMQNSKTKMAVDKVEIFLNEVTNSL